MSALISIWYLLERCLSQSVCLVEELPGVDDSLLPDFTSCLGKC